MKKYLFVTLLLLMTSQVGFSLETSDIPAGYVKLHSGAIVPIEDLQPASNKYFNTNAPNEIYINPNYNLNKKRFTPKVTGFFGRGFDFYSINAGNFNFGIMK